MALSAYGRGPPSIWALRNRRVAVSATAVITAALIVAILAAVL